jgi:hypothetical protein
MRCNCIVHRSIVQRKNTISGGINVVRTIEEDDVQYVDVIWQRLSIIDSKISCGLDGGIAAVPYSVEMMSYRRASVDASIECDCKSHDSVESDSNP